MGSIGVGDARGVVMEEEGIALSLFKNICIFSHAAAAVLTSCRSAQIRNNLDSRNGGRRLHVMGGDRLGHRRATCRLEPPASSGRSVLCPGHRSRVLVHHGVQDCRAEGRAGKG